MSWLSRLANVFRASKVDRDLDDELRFHIDARIDELVRKGLTRTAAEEQVVRQFGGQLRLREQSRDVKLLPWLDSLVQDIRFGIRTLRKESVVTAAAVVSLSLALGACMAAFSLVDALILRPLPVREPDQLIYLTMTADELHQRERDGFNYPLFERLREASRAHVELFGMSRQVMQSAVLDGAGHKEKVRTQFVSGNAFDVLGVRPAAGRLITVQDDRRPGEQPVAVVSHGFWMRRFGGDPRAIGRWFALEDTPAGPLQLQIVGVAEKRFTGVEPGRPTDIWLPNMMYAAEAFEKPWWNWFRIFGRMKDDIAVEQAQSVLQAAFTSFRRETVSASGFAPDESPEKVARFVRTPLHVRAAANGPSPLRQEFERPLWILAIVVALVLLIAGSNIANLFLARTAAREREMSLRLSIGAGRGRLMQQVLVESALVAGVACAGGLLFARIAAPAVVDMLATVDDPAHLGLQMDWRLAAFVIGAAMLSTALFGLGPAIYASSVAPMRVLKGAGGRVSARRAFRRPLVALQVGFSVIVLFVAGLLVVSFGKLSNVNPGFAASGVLLLSMESPEDVDPGPRRAAMLHVLDRLRDLPGVEGVSSAEVNLIGRALTRGVSLPGAQRERMEVTMAPVAPGFFETMRIPVVDGRGFVRRDVATESSTAIVVNETFARRYFGRERAVGRFLVGALDMEDPVARHEIVGVVADTKYDLREPAAPTLYIPLRPQTVGTFHVRTVDDSAAFVSRLREEVRDADPRFRVTAITPQSEVIARTLLRERLLALLAGLFSLVGLVLAAMGLYGVLSYSVVQRTKEIGIRLALGAQQREVVQSVVTDAVLTTIIGAACGLAGGLYLARFVRTLLYEVEPFDFWSLVLPVGCLLCAGVLAVALPARRAAHVDPVVALRHE